MYRLIVQHVLAFGNVTVGGGFIEFSSAMGTLNVIVVIANWRRWQIAELASCGQMCLHLLGRTYGVNEILVFTPPIRLYFRFLRFLHLFFNEPFLNKWLNISTLYSIHHGIELLSLLLACFYADLLMKSNPIWGESTTTRFTRHQSFGSCCSSCCCSSVFVRCRPFVRCCRNWRLCSRSHFTSINRSLILRGNATRGGRN